jgi:hypothetical protein
MFLQREVTSKMVFYSYGIVLRFHAGTAAFGGLLVAVVEVTTQCNNSNLDLYNLN